MKKGLANLGNTCSINTLIQCLGHCDMFRNFILENKLSIRKRNENNVFSICEELKLILHQLWIDNNSLAPKRFIKAVFESLGNDYSYGEQFDFTEILMILINNITEETHINDFKAKHQIHHHYGIPIFDYLQKKAQSSWDLFFKNSNSPINDILQGTQIQQVECNKCNKLYHNIEPFFFNYIEITENHILDSFRKLIKEEEITEWKCMECSSNEGTKAIRFWKLPNIWIIILKRFNNQQKVNDPFHITTEFIIEKGIEMSSFINNEPITYELKGIANHFGNLNGGHYNAICKNKDNDWYLYDDLNISKINDIHKILTNNTSAYVLFYERKNS